MDSEDDMHDANDVESDDDGFYSDENDAASDYNSNDDDDYLIEEDEDGINMIQARRPESNYVVLKELDIKERQEEDITSVSSVLSISRAASTILLLYYNWNVSEVHEAWFADEERVRNTVGLLPEPVVQFANSRELMCGICFEAFPRSKLKSATCGHPFCFECWEGYIRSSITDGPGCLMLSCPDPSCGAAVGQDMIHMFACDDDKCKYSKYLLRSFVEDNKKTKWCPAPGCEHAVNYVGDNENYDVSCLCSYDFCWNCTEETHRPVNCNTVKLWILKNSAESENMNWLCLGAWSNHGERTGGFYACNRYEAAKQEGVMEKLSEIQGQPESQLKFLSDAWQQIVKCRRVLKWTYAYGYYLTEHESAKKQFFEYLQGEAESGLERLHQCAEKELLPFLNADGPSQEFIEFHTKLAGLTAVTKSYFENLVRALENHLSDVDCHQTSHRATSSKNGTSKGKGGRGKESSRAGGSSRN
ncbi:hypothetical protein ACLB2K_035291 [Fragaria x ananassa]